MDRIENLEAALGYRFFNRSWLECALTHRSHAHEFGHSEHYERLEFLGDAVVGCVVASWLFSLSETLSEGELSKRKSRIVSTRSLAREAERLRLGDYLRLGAGEERSGGRSRPSLLADAYEAVLGAVFLDGGWAAAERVMRPFLERLREETWGEADAKSALQEEAQARGWPLPAYDLVEQIGPEHQPTFRVVVRVGSECYGPVEGRSKKEAEQRAAALALHALFGPNAGVSVPAAGLAVSSDETRG
jgi:ribonuclease-3